MPCPRLLGCHWRHPAQHWVDHVWVARMFCFGPWRGGMLHLLLCNGAPQENSDVRDERVQLLDVLIIRGNIGNICTNQCQNWLLAPCRGISLICLQSMPPLKAHLCICQALNFKPLLQHLLVDSIMLIVPPALVQISSKIRPLLSSLLLFTSIVFVTCLKNTRLGTNSCFSILTIAELIKCVMAAWINNRQQVVVDQPPSFALSLRTNFGCKTNL